MVEITTLEAEYQDTKPDGVKHYGVRGGKRFIPVGGQTVEASSPQALGFQAGESAAKLVKTQAGRQQVESIRQQCQQIVRLSRRSYQPQPFDRSGSRRLTKSEIRAQDNNYRNKLAEWEQGCQERVGHLMVGGLMVASEEIAFLQTRFKQADLDSSEQKAALAADEIQRRQIGVALKYQQDSRPTSIMIPSDPDFTLAERTDYRGAFTQGWQSVPEEKTPVKR